MAGRDAGERRVSRFQESVLLVALALLLALLVKHFLVQAFYIPSESMEPQFVVDDRILVEKVSGWGGDEPQRGDIVVFEDPGGWLSPQPGPGPLTRVLQLIGLQPEGGHLVKRVIGVGGDRVRCCDKRGRVTVNGHALDERAYLPPATVPSTDTFKVTVPAGKLWLMGDNRGHSRDSRGHLGDPGGGFVDVARVVGRVWTLIWPPGRAEIIDRPTTFDDIPPPR